MVKSKNQHNQKEGVKQGEKEGGLKTRRIQRNKQTAREDVIPTSLSSAVFTKNLNVRMQTPNSRPQKRYVLWSSKNVMSSNSPQEIYFS